MSPSVAVAVFLCLWWLVFFISLPLGRRAAAAQGASARLWGLKILASAAIAGLAVAMMAAVARWGWVTITP